MKKIIELINVDFSKDDKKILWKINLSFYEKQNTAFYSEEELNSCKFLIEIISKKVRPQNGIVEFSKVLVENRLNIGFNNFDSLFFRDFFVIDIIKTAIEEQKKKEGNFNKEELDEIIKFLNIDKIYDKNVLKLDIRERNVLNIFLLLIVKPKILLLKNLTIVGSIPFQTVALQYIKTYLTKHNITLLISTNDNLIIENLCERKIKIENSEVYLDNLSTLYNENKNTNNNDKTKKTNLTQDLFNIINNKKIEIDNFDNTGSNKSDIEISITDSLNNKTYEDYKVQYNFDEKVVDKTKKISDELEEILESNNNSKKETLSDTGIINNYSTIELKKAIEEEVDKFTKELTTKQIQNKEEIETLKKQINEIPKNNENLIIKESPNIVDTYYLRKKLMEQINSPDFIKLSIDLQRKVYENYDRSNQLILSNDPRGLKDPFEKAEDDFTRILTNAYEGDEILSESITNKFDEPSITRMILEEDIDNDILDTKAFTKQYDMPKHNTSNLVFDEIKTKICDTTEITKPVNNKTIQQEVEYLSNPVKKSRWSIFNKNKKELNDFDFDLNSRNKTLELINENFTQELKSEEVFSKVKKTTQFGEPVSTINDAKKTTNRDTKIYKKYNITEISDINKNIKSEIKEPLKTQAIKIREKKNSIEEMYEKAQAAKIERELKNKKK